MIVVVKTRLVLGQRSKTNRPSFRYNGDVMMEVSVRRLNHRLALQLPRELPLGLVFVVGVVEDVVRVPVAQKKGEGNGRTFYTQFDLTENNYHLRCIVPPREAAHVTLETGNPVRVGGHLMFDPGRADYFLLARDVAVVGQTAVVEPPVEDAKALRQEQEELALALASVKRRADAAKLAEAELPEWVQKIAPPEAQEEWTEEEETDLEADLLAATAVTANLDDELVATLAQAMDSEEEVEVTSDMLAQYDVQPEQPIAPAVAEVDTAVSPPPPQPRYTLPPDHHETDWLVILLIIAFFIMAMAMIVASVLLIL